MMQPATFRPRTTNTLGHVSTRHGEIHDVEAIEAMHGRCSESSLYRRFHAPLPRVSTRLVRQMVAPTGGWSLLAEHEGDVVGFACAAPVSSSEVDVGLLVEDRHQHQGLGARMLHEVALEAAERGFHRIQLFAQPDNERVLATVQRAGLIGRVTWHDHVLLVSMSVHRLTPLELALPV